MSREVSARAARQESESESGALFLPIFTEGEAFSLPSPRPEGGGDAWLDEFLESGIGAEAREGSTEFGREEDSGDAESGVQPDPEPEPEAILWLDGFVDTLVFTQGRRRASGASGGNAWEYPESGSCHSGDTLDGYDAYPEQTETLVLSDEAPNARDYARSGPHEEEGNPWFRVGQTEAARQDPWGAYYPTRGGSSNFRYRPRTNRVMEEVLHGSYRRRTTIYDSHNPDGPYAYWFDANDPFDDRVGWGPGEEGRFRLDAGLLPFTSNFNPDYAHFKSGPLYLQALWLESGALYSDYNGARNFPAGQGDGWLGYSSLALRGAARLNRNLYFVVNGEIVYLYGENKLGLRALGGLGGPSGLTSLHYRTEIGDWQVELSNILGTGSFFNLNDYAQVDAYDRAGRYYFGYLDNDRSRDWLLYDPVVYNRISARAARPVGEDWRISLRASHYDYYYFDRGSEHRHRESIGATFGARSGRIPFSPYASYEGDSFDYFDSMANRVYVGGRGALSDRVRIDGRVGYYWPSGDGAHTRNTEDRFLWGIGLTHDISSQTQQTLRFGQDYFIRDFSDDTVHSDYIRYGFRHNFSDRTTFRAFAQWSQDDFVTGGMADHDFYRQIYGTTLWHRVTDDLWTECGYYYQRGHKRDSDLESDRHIVFGSISARLTERSVGFFRYQFESFDQESRSFDEHLYTAGVRRYF